jgi:hypothetical protein
MPDARCRLVGRFFADLTEDFVREGSFESVRALVAASQTNREERAYALDRALSTRGGDFPIIALFPSSVETSLIPASIRVRLDLDAGDLGLAAGHRQGDLLE